MSNLKSSEQVGYMLYTTTTSRMKQLIQTLKNGELKIEEVPIPFLKSGSVLVRNHFSLISAGTEKMTIELAQKNLMGKARERPDLVKQVIEKVRSEGVISTFRKVMGRLDSPVPMGYSCVGRVEGVGQGIDEFQIGDRVACAGTGYANHAEVVCVLKNLCVKVPDKLDIESAAFVTVGAIALQGVRQAELSIGESVAVIGLGLLGQITVQIVKAAGCKVLGIDLNAGRVELAEELGADCAVLRNDVAKGTSFTKGVGVDAVIITAATSSSDPIELAGEISRDKGRVVVVGAVGMEIQRRSYYEKELDLRLSRSYGPGRYDLVYEEKGIDYPIGYVRWTERRNMEEFLYLVSQGKVNVKRIITHTFAFANALKAYDLITGKTQEPFLGVLLKYDVDAKLESRIHLKDSHTDGRKYEKEKSEIQVGVIGAGNFAKGVLLPNLKRIQQVNIKAIATASGLSAKHVGEKYNCEYVTSDYVELLNDSQIDAIMIATRHNLHAKMVIEALSKGKAVFVEKPLAISKEELEAVIEAWETNQGRLMVGFNRRFAPLTSQVKQLLANRIAPLCIIYRVNAGAIPKDNWVQDPDVGGGRIIGEVCHFVDFLQYLTNSQPFRVYTERIENSDNVFITINFRDNSLGTIGYFANGDKSFPKERVEIFGNDSVAVIDDFNRGKIVTNGKHKKLSEKFSGRQDKGYRAELEAFVQAVKSGGEMPIPFQQIVMTTLTTFKILESISEGAPVEIPPLSQTSYWMI